MPRQVAKNGDVCKSLFYRWLLIFSVDGALISLQKPSREKWPSFYFKKRRFLYVFAHFVFAKVTF